MFMFKSRMNGIQKTVHILLAVIFCIVLGLGVGILSYAWHAYAYGDPTCAFKHCVQINSRLDTAPMQQ